MKHRTALLPSLLLLAMAFHGRSSAEECVVTIRAIDEQGRGVPGAQVLWVPYKDGLRKAFPREYERAATDDAGNCTIDFREHPDYERNNFSVRIVRDAYSAGYQRVYPKRDHGAAMSITVTERAVVRGEIRDTQRQPIEGVVVGSSWFPMTTSDADGRFEIVGDGNGTGTLSLFKEGYAWTTHGGARGSIDVVLGPGAVVTFELVDEQGQPLPGAVARYKDNEVIADNKGHAQTLPLPPATRVHVQAWHYADGARYWLQGTRFTVAGQSPQVERLVLQRRDKEKRDQVHISGRVVVAGTGEGVRAHVLMADGLHDFDYSADEQAVTEKDGTFRIENVYQAQHFLQARPISPTLYPVDGVVQVDCRESSAEDLVLTVDQGCAVRGEVLYTDGSEVDRQWVSLSQAGSSRQCYARRGRFRFANLPPEPAMVRIECARQSVEAALPGPGQTLKGVAIRVPTESEKARVAGVVVNAAGEPQSGLRVMLRIAGGEERPAVVSGGTDVKGRFSLVTEHLGRADIGDVYALRQHVAGGHAERRGVDCVVMERPEPFQLAAGSVREDLRIVVAVPRAPVWRGAVGPREAKPQSKPVESEAPETYAVRVIDPAGEPIRRIVVHAAEALSGARLQCTERIEEVRPSRASAATILTSEDGRYDVPNCHLVWAERTCRQLVCVRADEDLEEPLGITLYPEGALTIRVEDSAGRPVKGVKIVPAHRGRHYLHSNGYRLPKSNGRGEVIFPSLPPGDYAFALIPRGVGERARRFVFVALEAGRDATAVVVAGPYREGSADALLEALCETLTTKYDVPGEELWAEVPSADRRRIGKAALERLLATTSLVSRDVYAYAEVVRLAGIEAAVQPLKRLSRLEGREGIVWPDQAIPFAIAALGGNAAVPYFEAAAQDQTLSGHKRTLAVIALNRIGTKKSLAAWRRLRDAARNVPGAPQRQQSYTPIERMAEALRMTLEFIPNAQKAKEVNPETAQVNKDGRSGRMSAGTHLSGVTEYVFRREGDEWLVVDIGRTVIA